MAELIPPTLTSPSGVKYSDFLSQTPEQIQNEKRALLALMAERGTEGQIEFERNKQLAQAARAASIERAAARGAQINAPATLAQELTQDYDSVLKNQLAMSDAGMLAHGREMDRISAANAAYMDQIGGAAQLAQAMITAQAAAGGGGGGGGGGGYGGRGGGGGGGGDGSYAVDAADTLPESALQLGQALGRGLKMVAPLLMPPMKGVVPGGIRPVPMSARYGPRVLGPGEGRLDGNAPGDVRLSGLGAVAARNAQKPVYNRPMPGETSTRKAVGASASGSSKAKAKPKAGVDGAIRVGAKPGVGRSSSKVSKGKGGRPTKGSK